jgi:TonB family protein
MATKRLTQKSYLVSFMIHSMVFFGYLWFLNTKVDIQKASDTVIFEMNLSQFVEPTPPEPIVQETTPPPPPVAKPKPIIKDKPIIPIEKKEEIVKPIQENTVVSEPLVTQQVAEPIKQATPAPTPAQQQQAFVQTNFTIIRDMVLRNLVYPSMAKRMGHIGVVEVTLVIDTNGKLVKYFISQGSDSKLLDKATLDSVEKVANADFPKPQTTSTIVLPVSFRLN